MLAWRVLITILLLLPSAAFANQIDFDRTFSSGKLTTIPTPPGSTTPGNMANTSSQNNFQPPAPDQMQTPPPVIQQPESFAATSNSAWSSEIPTINTHSSTPLSLGSSSTAAPLNYTAKPTMIVLTEHDKKRLAEAKKYDEDMLKAFNYALETNFSTYKYPKEYYSVPFSKDNQHLPPVNFASYYAALAFRYVIEDKYVNVRFFIDQYNFTDIRNKNGHNLLMTAAVYNSINSARMLLMKKIFYIDEQDKEKQTSLHIAVNNENLEMTKLLLTMGASPKIKDINNKTPLEYAEESNNDDLVNLLLAYNN